MFQAVSSERLVCITCVTVAWVCTVRRHLLLLMHAVLTPFLQALLPCGWQRLAATSADRGEHVRCHARTLTFEKTRLSLCTSVKTAPRTETAVFCSGTLKWKSCAITRLAEKETLKVVKMLSLGQSNKEKGNSDLKNGSRRSITIKAGENKIFW